MGMTFWTKKEVSVLVRAMPSLLICVPWHPTEEIYCDISISNLRPCAAAHEKLLLIDDVTLTVKHKIL